MSERVREQPVWKQRKSQLRRKFQCIMDSFFVHLARICSASDGTWVVCEGEEVLLKSSLPCGDESFTGEQVVRCRHEASNHMAARCQIRPGRACGEVGSEL